MRDKERDFLLRDEKPSEVFLRAKTRRFRDGFLITIQFSGSIQGLLLRPETINIPHAGMNHLGFTKRGFPVSWVGMVGASLFRCTRRWVPLSTVISIYQNGRSRQQRVR